MGGTDDGPSRSSAMTGLQIYRRDRQAVFFDNCDMAHYCVPPIAQFTACVQVQAFLSIVGASPLLSLSLY